MCALFVYYMLCVSINFTVCLHKHPSLPSSIGREVRYGIQKQLKGGLSGLMKAAFREFFGSTWNFKLGFNCPSGQNTFVMVRSEVGCGVQDEKAHKEFDSVKGASGTSFCLFCKNVTQNLKGLKKTDYIKDYRTTFPEDFDKHTPQTFWDSVNLLSESINVVSGPKLKKLQQALGLTYCPDGILWSKPCDYCPIEHTFIDWMHTLHASGGMGQVELNAFCIKLVEEGISLSEVDNFMESVVTPDGFQKLPKGFFSARTPLKKGDHIKSFASETMTAIRHMCLFVDMVVLPSKNPALRQAALSMKALGKMCDIFAAGDSAINHLHELYVTGKVHHQHFLDAYGPDLAKPKLHLIYHCIDNLAKHLRNMNCFAPERLHAAVKNLARTVGGGMCKQEELILKRTLINVISHFKSETSVQHTFFPVKAKPAPHIRDNIVRVSPRPLGQEVLVASVMMSHIGKLLAGEVVVMRSPRPLLGLIINFVAGVCLRTDQKVYFLCLRPFSNIGEHVWSPSLMDMYCPADGVDFAVPYVKVSGGIRPLLPQHSHLYLSSV